jgi:hypothetical protein
VGRLDKDDEAEKVQEEDEDEDDDEWFRTNTSKPLNNR